jgi:hypothetical protein
MVEARFKNRLVVCYRAIKSLEDEIWRTSQPTAAQLAQWRDEIENIDAHACRMRISQRYFPDLYALKQAIGIVRDRIGQVAGRMKE